MSHASAVHRSWSTVGLIFGLLSASCGGSARSDELVVSSWFGACRSDPECAVGQCVCGLCSAACSSAADRGSCAGVAGTSCFANGHFAYRGLCAGRDVPGICLPECSAVARCDGGLSCVAGVCLPESVVAPGETALAAPRVCAQSPVVQGSVYAWRRDQIASLEGCEVIEGDLVIAPFPGIELFALRQLRAVLGTLNLGGGEALRWAATRGFVDTAAEPTPASLTSLVGLEALEEVGSLELQKVGVRDVSPLSRLHSIGPSQPGLSSGQLYIDQCNELENILGLASLVSLHRLEIHVAPRLSSLQGLAGVTELRELVLDGGLGLSSLDGLELPTELDVLHVQASGISNFGALSGIERVGELSLDGVPHYDVLPSLQSVERLYLGAGPADASQAFASLRSLRSLSIIRHNQLIAPPRFDALGDTTRGVSLEIVDNDNLASLPAMPGIRAFDVVHVEENESLGTIELPAMETATLIDVRDNAALTDMRLDGLVVASQAVRVTGNSALLPDALSELSDVETPQLKLAGNSGDSRELDPCPWVLDGACDEFPLNLCAPDSDTEDCYN